MKVLIATEKPFSPVAVGMIKPILEKAGHEVVMLESYKSAADLIAAVADVHAMIVRSDLVTPEVVAAAKELKLVVRAGAGYDTINLGACNDAKIVVMNTPGQNSNAVAELAFGLMISLVRGGYKGTMGTELKEKNLGIHAYGNVGLNTARIGKGFGMKVFGFDPFVSDEKMIADGVTPVKSAEELYEKCHVVSLNMPKTKETIGSINYNLMSKMPAGAVLINTARVEVVNEADLDKIMGERKDFKYGADVAPVAAKDLKEKFGDRVFFTLRKMGAQTDEANINSGVASANQINDFFANGNKQFQVNKF